MKGEVVASTEIGSRRRSRFVFASRAAMFRLAILFVLIAITLIWCWYSMILMPGASFRGALPSLAEDRVTLAAQLQADVQMLAGTVGPRSPLSHRKMGEAAQYIIDRLAQSGFDAHEEVPVPAGAQTPNIIVEVIGSQRPSEIIVIGAHYDTYPGTPGADDNASGVAGVLALAAAFAEKPQARTLRFAFFVNEEPPNFQTPSMGSWVYARQCKAKGENIVAMWSLESIGYYSDAPASQQYPTPLSLLYPSQGNFIAFVGNFESRELVRRTTDAFRRLAQFPAEGAALPGVISGVGWSDHWAFWQEGYPALMVTCTAPFRNPNYHLATDTPDTLDYERAARVVYGLELVLMEFANTP